MFIIKLFKALNHK